MTTPLLPPLYFDPPAAAEVSYGLFSVALGPQDLPPHGIGGGVQYQPDSCTDGHLYPSVCDYGAVPEPTKIFDGVEEALFAPPFRVYAGLVCGSQTRDFAWMTDRVRRRLVAGEQTAVESQFWGLGTTADFPSYLHSGIAVTNLGPAANVTAGLSLLEQQLATCYGHPGVIHVRPRLMAFLAEAHQLVRDQGVWKTYRGNRVSAGDGYSGLGPGNDAPTATTEWMYATGRVSIWRSPDILIPDARETFDRAANQYKLIAERDYAMAAECCVAAVEVTIP
ncbi:MAG: hypothetical protein ABW222_13480 [Actinomycetota bacterium]